MPVHSPEYNSPELSYTWHFQVGSTQAVPRSIQQNANQHMQLITVYK